jgi:chromosome segregation ATPase
MITKKYNVKYKNKTKKIFGGHGQSASFGGQRQIVTNVTGLSGTAAVKSSGPPVKKGVSSGSNGIPPRTASLNRQPRTASVNSRPPKSTKSPLQAASRYQDNKQSQTGTSVVKVVKRSGTAVSNGPSGRPYSVQSQKGTSLKRVNSSPKAVEQRSLSLPRPESSVLNSRISSVGRGKERPLQPRRRASKYENLSVPATSVPAEASETSVPATLVPATLVPANSVPANSVPANSVPATSESKSLQIKSIAAVKNFYTSFGKEVPIKQLSPEISSRVALSPVALPPEVETVKVEIQKTHAQTLRQIRKFKTELQTNGANNIKFSHLQKISNRFFANILDLLIQKQKILNPTTEYVGDEVEAFKNNYLELYEIIRVNQTSYLEQLSELESVPNDFLKTMLSRLSQNERDIFDFLRFDINLLDLENKHSLNENKDSLYEEKINNILKNLINKYKSQLILPSEYTVDELTLYTIPNELIANIIEILDPSLSFRGRIINTSLEYLYEQVSNVEKRAIENADAVASEIEARFSSTKKPPSVATRTGTNILQEYERLKSKTHNFLSYNPQNQLIFQSDLLSILREVLSKKQKLLESIKTLPHLQVSQELELFVIKALNSTKDLKTFSSENILSIADKLDIVEGRLLSQLDSIVTELDTKNKSLLQLNSSHKKSREIIDDYNQQLIAALKSKAQTHTATSPPAATATSPPDKLKLLIKLHSVELEELTQELTLAHAEEKNKLERQIESTSSQLEKCLEESRVRESELQESLRSTKAKYTGLEKRMSEITTTQIKTRDSLFASLNKSFTNLVKLKEEIESILPKESKTEQESILPKKSKTNEEIKSIATTYLFCHSEVMSLYYMLIDKNEIYANNFPPLNEDKIQLMGKVTSEINDTPIIDNVGKILENIGADQLKTLTDELIRVKEIASRLEPLERELKELQRNSAANKSNIADLSSKIKILEETFKSKQELLLKATTAAEAHSRLLESELRKKSELLQKSEINFNLTLYRLQQSNEKSLRLQKEVEKAKANFKTELGKAKLEAEQEIEKVTADTKEIVETIKEELKLAQEETKKALQNSLLAIEEKNTAIKAEEEAKRELESIRVEEAAAKAKIVKEQEQLKLTAVEESKRFLDVGIAEVKAKSKEEIDRLRLLANTAKKESNEAVNRATAADVKLEQLKERISAAEAAAEKAEQARKKADDNLVKVESEKEKIYSAYSELQEKLKQAEQKTSRERINKESALRAAKYALNELDKEKAKVEKADAARKEAESKVQQAEVAKEAAEVAKEAAEVAKVKAEAKLTAAESEIKNKEAETKAAEAKLTAAEAIIKRTTDELQKEKEAKVEADAKAAQLDAEAKAAQAEQVNAKAKILELSKTIKDKETEAAQALKQLAGLQQNVADAGSSLKTITEELETVTKQKNEAKIEAQVTKEELTKAQAEAEAAVQKRKINSNRNKEKLKQESDNAIKKFDKAIRSNKTKTFLVDALRKKVKQLNDEKKEAKIKLDRAQEEIKSTISKATQSEEEKEKAKLEIEQLQRQIDEAQERIGNLNSELAEKKLATKSAEIIILKLFGELTTAKKDEQQLVDKSEHLNEQLRESENARERAKAELEDATKQIEALERETVLLTAEKNEIQRRAYQEVYDAKQREKASVKLVNQALLDISSIEELLESSNTRIVANMRKYEEDIAQIEVKMKSTEEALSRTKTELTASQQATQIATETHIKTQTVIQRILEEKILFQKDITSLYMFHQEKDIKGFLLELGRLKTQSNLSQEVKDFIDKNLLKLFSK